LLSLNPELILMSFLLSGNLKTDYMKMNGHSRTNTKANLKTTQKPDETQSKVVFQDKLDKANKVLSKAILPELKKIS
jgi:hypothetical protein